MSRIHPAVTNKSSELLREIHEGGRCDSNQCPSKFTVWKKSSMSFEGTDGFTVFDEYGRLTFRVDNYSRKNDRTGGGGGGLVLMDGSGKALLTLRPKGLSMQRGWNAYGGDCTGRGQSRKFRLFSMRKSLAIPFLDYNSSYKDEAKPELEAEVFIGGSRGPEFRIEGSFRRRNCCIRRTSTGEIVAKISRKRVNPKVLLSNEVFSLVVQPGLDNGLIMGFIVVLDRICCRPIGPLLCSC
ncbi:protein LURP-one-related 5-like [Punica granatum]|uniref:Uncharacterized protein n=2 Tax=Punica granatum TaxID=22663 RepID=A0A2I0IAI3_PUNGR|nr:protein LURP-one-related 5-like [Punica granatum]PKI41014.1 hypothetical protein CRG98_038542 [Punica granatum]